MALLVNLKLRVKAKGQEVMWLFKPLTQVVVPRKSIHKDERNKEKDLIS